ncbi:hypothetical protein CHUAL_004642 [Chamberlinius hualienensis]
MDTNFSLNMFEGSSKRTSVFSGALSGEFEDRKLHVSRVPLEIDEKTNANRQPLLSSKASSLKSSNLFAGKLEQERFNLLDKEWPSSRKLSPPQVHSSPVKQTSSWPTTDFISRKVIEVDYSPPSKNNNNRSRDKEFAVCKGSIDHWDSKLQKHLVFSLSDVPGHIWAADNSNGVLQEALRITNHICMKRMPQPER